MFGGYNPQNWYYYTVRWGTDNFLMACKINSLQDFKKLVYTSWGAIKTMILEILR